MKGEALFNTLSNKIENVKRGPLRGTLADLKAAALVDATNWSH